MSQLPSVVLFDVNETLSDLSPLADRFADLGAPELLPTWFAGVLRDGIALTAAGAFAPFRDVASDVLRSLLTSRPGWHGDLPAAIEHVLDGFGSLSVHPDVPEGIAALHAAGFRLATLTNGSVQVTERLLDSAGLRGHFEAVLDVTAPRAWKPAAAAYHYALGELHVDAADAVLVAVHPWDVDGARRAGLQGAWLRRGPGAYPAVMSRPTLTVDDLRDLAGAFSAAG